MLENGNGNSDKMDEERNEKGQFMKGWSGGPGRSKKADMSNNLDEVDFWKETKKLIKRDMQSDSETTRVKMLGLYLKWKVLRDESLEKQKQRDIPMSQETVRILSQLAELMDLQHELEGLGFSLHNFRKIIDHCPSCDWFRENITAE